MLDHGFGEERGGGERVVRCCVAEGSVELSGELTFVSNGSEKQRGELVLDRGRSGAVLLCLLAVLLSVATWWMFGNWYRARDSVN